MAQGDQYARQVQYLEQLAASEIRNVDMTAAEREEKESFRAALETVCLEVCVANPERLPKVSLECFGSFKSGFATAGSDMDLVIVVQDNTSSTACFSLLEDDLPRALEKRLLHLGYGARLLTRTRVPIIKVCEKPDPCFLDKLREEREKWDYLPDEKKYPHLYPEQDEGDVEAGEQAADGAAAQHQTNNVNEARITADAVQRRVIETGTFPNGESNEVLNAESVQDECIQRLRSEPRNRCGQWRQAQTQARRYEAMDARAQSRTS